MKKRSVCVWNVLEITKFKIIFSLSQGEGKCEERMRMPKNNLNLDMYPQSDQKSGVLQCMLEINRKKNRKGASVNFRDLVTKKSFAIESQNTKSSELIFKNFKGIAQLKLIAVTVIIYTWVCFNVEWRIVL